MKRKADHPAPGTVRARGSIEAALQDAEQHVHGHRARPVSLWPLDFAAALDALLAVPWPPKKKKKRGQQQADNFDEQA
ncbi:MAG: hypothetical protein ACHQ9S_08430 [Candidatus Binatia bacterium]